jgi:CheY-like chemotaxis protein
LGLALVKGLVELHGGQVGVHSDGLGHGAVFTVHLPIAAAPTVTGTVDASPEKPAAGLHALLVEDNRDVAEMLRLLLEKAGHKVDVAFSGTAGVEAARRLLPDIVLCDVGLPGMDGYAVARSLREDPNTASLWLVALTGYGDPDHQRRSLDAGFDLHLTKPVALAALERLLAARFPA